MQRFSLIEFILSRLVGHSLPKEKIFLGIMGFIYLSLIFISLFLFIYYFVKKKLYLEYDTKKIKILLFLLFFIPCLSSAFWVNNFNPCGDEPYYLISAHSLAIDGDLDFYNNAQHKDWKKFYKDELLMPPEMFLMFSKDQNPTYYYLPGIGTTLLIAPGYKIAGRLGVFFIIALVGALILVNLYHCSLDLSNDKQSAFIGSVLVGFSAPIFSYSQQIYPEIFAALLIIFIVKSLFFKLQLSKLNYIIIGICIALLPIVHIKYAIVSFFFLVISLYLNQTRKFRSYFYILLPLIMIMIIYVTFFYRLIGSLLPLRSYIRDSETTSISVFSKNIQPIKQIFGGSFLGLLFDQEFGLFIYAPIYLVLGLGISIFIKIFKKSKAFFLIIFVFLYYFFISCIRGWHGAEFARYMVPIIPILGVFISVAISRCQDKLFKRIVYFLAIISFIITFLVTLWPPFRYGTNDGMNKILEKLNFPRFKITDILPDSYSVPNYIVLSSKGWILSIIYLVLIILFTIYFYKKSNLES